VFTDTRHPWDDIDWSGKDPLAVWRLAPPSKVPVAVADQVRGAALLAVAAAAEDDGSSQYHLEVLGRAEARDAASLMRLVAVAWRVLPMAPPSEDDAGDSDRRMRDVRGSLAWSALRLGLAWARVPLIGMLAELPEEDRTPYHDRIVERLAAGLPHPTTPEDVVANLRLKLPAPTAGFRSVDEPAAPLVSGPARRLLPESTQADALPREGRIRLRRLLDPLPLRPWPAADALAAALAAEFPWASELIDLLHADLALAQTTAGAAYRIRPLVLLGAPGCGKSRFLGRLLALVQASGGPGGVVFPVAGTADNRVLAGTARGWASESPSLPVHQALLHEAANPILALDELDKAGGSERNGDISQSLLTMLEPSTSRRWLDEGLALPVDLSGISWLFTANRRDRISALLRTRLRFVSVPQPRPKDFPVLFAGTLADLAADLDCRRELLPAIPDDVINMVQDGFRRGRLSARAVSGLLRRAVEGAARGEAAAATRH
jgi:hypothetical protein